MKRYYYYRCTSVDKKGWQVCSTKEASTDRLEKYILENLERISVDKNYLENLVFKLNHGFKSSRSLFKKSNVPQQSRLEPSGSCSKFSKFNPETIASLLQSFLLFLSQRRRVERNLLVKKFLKEVIYSPETIKITLFYSENLKNPALLQKGRGKESPALPKQGRANFWGASQEGSLTPQHLELVSENDGASIRPS